MSTENSPLLIKALSPGELAAQYGITTKTLKTWLRPHLQLIGIRVGRYFTTLQVKRIYQCIGSPQPIFVEP